MGSTGICGGRAFKCMIVLWEMGACRSILELRSSCMQGSDFLIIVECFGTRGSRVHQLMF